MEDDHRDGGGVLEGLGDQHQLLGGGEERRERRQILQRDVGRQRRVQSQHGRYDAVGEQAFWLHTAEDRPHRGSKKRFKERKKERKKSGLAATVCYVFSSCSILLRTTQFIYLKTRFVWGKRNTFIQKQFTVLTWTGIFNVCL